MPFQIVAAFLRDLFLPPAAIFASYSFENKSFVGIGSIQIGVYIGKKAT